MNDAFVFHVVQTLNQLVANTLEVIWLKCSWSEVILFQEVVEVFVKELKDNDDVLSEFEVVLNYHYFVMTQNVFTRLQGVKLF